MSPTRHAFRRRIIPILVDLAPFLLVLHAALSSSAAFSPVVIVAVSLALFLASLLLNRSPHACVDALAFPLTGTLRGRWVWITGATQGLGESLALRCAELGASVVVSGRTAERCEDVALECLSRGAPRVRTVPLDLYDGREKLAEAVREAFEGVAEEDEEASVDIFVNCAGGSQASSALAGEDEEVDRMIFQLNALGAISLTKEVAKAMTKRQIVQGGKRRKFAPRIVGVCSVASKVPAPGQATYAAAKSAYAAFLNSMRSEIADTGVKVVCVYPGPIATGTDGKERVIFRSRLSASSPGAQRVGAASPSSNAKRTQSPPSQSSPSTKGRMSVPFVTEEIIRSTIAGADELILAPPAIMFLASVVRFAPTLAYAILDLVGPRRASKADAGENIYDLSSRRRVKKSSSTM